MTMTPKELEELEELEDDEPFQITDVQIQKALDFLQSNATEAAQARADRIYLEQYRKSLKAMLMSERGSLPVNAQERDAYADPKYQKHLAVMREAIFHDEKSRFLREAEQARIDAWQTMSANKRGNRP